MKQEDTGIIICHVVKHKFDEYIGRTSPIAKEPASVWANPFPLPEHPTPADRLEILRKYRAHVLQSPELIERLKRGELLNKRLACWCYREPFGPAPPEVAYCHGDVLRELQALFYEPPVQSDKAEEAKEQKEEAKSGAIVTVKQKGDFARFPGSETITSRIVWKEDFGQTKDGAKVKVAVAYNMETDTNYWYVALVGVGREMFAMKSFGQTKTNPNVRRMLEAALRELSTQLRTIQGITGFYTFVPKDRKALEEGIRGNWPKGVPTDGKEDIPTEHKSAKKYTQAEQKRETRERELRAKAKEAAKAGIIEVEAFTPSLFD